MKTDGLRFKDSAAARSYISNLAYKFDEPEHMVEFLHACDIAQAALTHWLFHESWYYRLQRALKMKEARPAMNLQAEIEEAWNKYSQASDEFQLAKERLQKIVSKLEPDHILHPAS